jgi:hypothetical protein
MQKFPAVEKFHHSALELMRGERTQTRNAKGYDT